jgi:hypothetical protein
MNEKRIIDKTMVTRAVITKIKNDWNPQMIKAQHLKDFNDPETIYIKGNKKERGYKPDIIALNETQTNIYEIELNKQMPVAKWRLFSNYARENNGNLYIVVPDYLKEEIKKEIQEKDIYTGLIYFETK